VEATIHGVVYTFREDVYYSAAGLWVAVGGDLARVGIGDCLYHAISPNLNLIALRPPGTEVRQGEEMGSFDMVKADIAIPSPVSGVIEEINEELESHLWLVDTDRYNRGWLAVFRLTQFTTDRENLLDVHDYRAMLEVEGEGEPSTA
jgi:glycine cleavage system H protein